MFDISQVKTIIILKLHQLKRESSVSLSYHNLLDYLFEIKWKNELPEKLNDIATDILNIKVEEVVAFLSFKAIKDAKQTNLSDYQDIIQ